MLKACKKCRREGDKLMLKGERCFSPKCAITRRSYIPGQHGPTSRSKLSEYGRQLREKQKTKRIYGIAENDIRRIYQASDKMTGNKAINFMNLLESRLDNVIYRCGVVSSRSEARQVVNHGHVMLNGKKLSIPSAKVSVGDVITFKKEHNLNGKKIKSASWIKHDEKKNSFNYLQNPSREEIDLNINENLVLEYYSR